MKTIGTFLLGTATGIGATLLFVQYVGKKMLEEEALMEAEDTCKFNDCGYDCDCECHEEEHNEEVVTLDSEDKLVARYFVGECECDTFGQEVECEHLEDHVRDMRISVKDLTPQGKAKLEAVLGFELDENAHLDDASIDMLRMAILEQE